MFKVISFEDNFDVYREYFDSYSLLFQYEIFKERTVTSVTSGDGEIRTLDPLLARQVLSQLSYAPSANNPKDCARQNRRFCQ